MSLPVGPLLRKFLGLGVAVGILAVAVIGLSETKAARASHIAGSPNGHQDTAAVVGNLNLETRATVFAHESCGYSSTDGIAACGASGGVGVHGYTPGGTGVLGRGDITGVRAESLSSSGTALDVDGKAKFSRSGKTPIGAGLAKIDITMMGLTTASLVPATLHGPPITGLYVASVQVLPGKNKFTIYLNKAVPAGMTATVGWVVVN
jgi:hypothetical protein